MKKTFLALTLISAVVLTNSSVLAKEKTDSGDKFTDISKHWACASINKVADKDIFADKDGKFLPDNAISRSEFAVMLHKALGINIAYFKAIDIGEFFDDVKNEDKYASNLYDLAAANIIDDKEHYRPGGMLPREEMVHYIMNAYRYKLGDNYRMIKIVPNPFADENDINPSYSGQIERAENMGLVVKPANNLFHPKEYTTRAQAAAVIERLVNRLEKEMKEKVQVLSEAEAYDGTFKMKLSITNNTLKPVTINHNSGQKFDFALLSADKSVLYTWSANKRFIMELTETVIEPGKSIEFTVNVEKGEFDSIMGKAACMKAYIMGTSNEFKINEDGYEAGIKW
ncbi:MAG TPA: S-layer homology domain-containing protein [Clostridia bacterium]